MTDLIGKVVVVTGASSGIGRATAIEFAREGCNVVLTARRQEALEQAARACREAGGKALPIVADVTEEEDVARLVIRQVPSPQRSSRRTPSRSP